MTLSDHPSGRKTSVDQSKSRTLRFISLIGAGCMIGACTTAPTRPVPIWMGAISPASSAPMLTANTMSWRERKFDGLIRQQTDFSCGAAALATIFNGAFQHDTTEQQVLVNMLRVADPDIVREQGFSLLDMKTYVLAIGMTAEGYRIDYPRLQTLNLPIIALIDVRGYKHFVVVRRAFEDRVAIGDPALGNLVMSRSDFEAAWNQVAFVVQGEGYDPDNALLAPPEPLSARRLLAMHGAIPAAEAAEFGFGRDFKFSF